MTSYINTLHSIYRRHRRQKAYSYKVGTTRYTVFIRYNANGTIRHRIETREMKGGQA